MKETTSAQVEKARTAAAVARTKVELLEQENSALVEILTKILDNQNKSRRQDLINVLFWVVCFCVLIYDKVTL